MVEHRIVNKLAKFAYSSRGRAFAIDVQLSYDSHDPYAVSLSFSEPRDRETVCVFSRELLRDGLDAEEGEMVGIGDVRLRPMKGVKGTMTTVKLKTPDGHHTLKAPSRDLRDFYDRTQEVVPMNEEDKWYDIDEEIRKLFPYPYQG